jgi:hypothetical protein
MMRTVMVAWGWFQPGGPWYGHVRINQARRDGYHKDAGQEMVRYGYKSRLGSLRGMLVD